MSCGVFLLVFFCCLPVFQTSQMIQDTNLINLTKESPPHSPLKTKSTFYAQGSLLIFIFSQIEERSLHVDTEITADRPKVS